jgi:hypothetical protein
MMKRQYYYQYGDMLYKLIGKGKAQNVKTGEIETTYVLKNSGFKKVWVNE